MTDLMVICGSNRFYRIYGRFDRIANGPQKLTLGTSGISGAFETCSCARCLGAFERKDENVVQTMVHPAPRHANDGPSMLEVFKALILRNYAAGSSSAARAAAFAANIPTINRHMAEARVFDEYENGEPVAPAPIIERPPFDSLHLCRREDETVGVFTLPARGATRGLWLYARENGRVLQQGLAHIVRAFAETAVWVASRADGRARE